MGVDFVQLLHGLLNLAGHFRARGCEPGERGRGRFPWAEGSEVPAERNEWGTAASQTRAGAVLPAAWRIFMALSRHAHPVLELLILIKP